MTKKIQDNLEKTDSFFDDMESFKKGNDVNMEDLVKLEKIATEYEE